MRKPRDYWTKLNCQNEALKYTRISDFKKYSGSAYNSAKSNNWLVEITKHIKCSIKPSGYWQDKENCKIEALKYKTKREFRFKSSGAYSSCIKNKWIDELCQHMNRIGHRYLKCVYVYEFSDNHAYVGITYNIEKRIYDRNKCKTDSVTEHINKTGNYPKLKQITDYIDVNDAVCLEDFYVKKYLNEGWIILNKSKTGSIGSVNIWTKEKCIEIAKECKTRTEFCKNTKGAYDAARRYGWREEIYSIVGL
jgi:predicted GIY-YIG superfamily endonuclease